MSFGVIMSSVLEINKKKENRKCKRPFFFLLLSMCFIQILENFMRVCIKALTKLAIDSKSFFCCCCCYYECNLRIIPNF